MVRYVAVGHPTFDTVDHGALRLGGSVTYASRLADRLGLATMLAGRASPALALRLSAELPRTDLQLGPSTDPTHFELTHDDAGERTLRLLSFAGRMGPLPELHDDDVVHVAPVADELDGWISTPIRPAFVGLTAQGLLRRWGALPGPIHLVEPSASVLADLDVDAVVVSESEVTPAAPLLLRAHELGAVVVVTRGADGASAWRRGVHHEHRPALSDRGVLAEATVGAGDTFAAGLFLALADGADLPGALAAATSHVSDLLGLS